MLRSSWRRFDEISDPPAAGTPMINEGHRWSPPVLGGEWNRSLRHRRECWNRKRCWRVRERWGIWGMVVRVQGMYSRGFDQT